MTSDMKIIKIDSPILINILFLSGTLQPMIYQHSIAYLLLLLFYLGTCVFQQNISHLTLFHTQLQ